MKFFHNSEEENIRAFVCYKDPSMAAEAIENSKFLIYDN